jgi:hypothetical protein
MLGFEHHQVVSLFLERRFNRGVCLRECLQ